MHFFLDSKMWFPGFSAVLCVMLFYSPLFFLLSNIDSSIPLTSFIKGIALSSIQADCNSSFLRTSSPANAGLFLVIHPSIQSKLMDNLHLLAH